MRRPEASRQTRVRVAQLAARLMADDGVADFSTAKRKAARQLGVPDGRCLPGNAEVEEALRTHLALYHATSQPAELGQLRRVAVEVMEFLADFEPRLTGSVLRGTATRHSNINLQVFPDNPKELEMMLLNHDIPFRLGERSFRFGDERVVQAPSYRIEREGIPVEISVLPLLFLRQAPRSGLDGRPMERARLEQVRALADTGLMPESS